MVLELRGRCDGQVSRVPSLDMFVVLVVQSFPVVAGLKFRWFGREGWEGQVIRWTKKEGGRGRVLWIEESSVHPRSGLGHGRSAQQELLVEWGVWAGTRATYLLRRRSRHHPGGTYLRTYVPFLLRAQLARATRGGARVLLADCSETVASHTEGGVGRRA